jgi:transcriptional regulator with XRE-family HTH domain
MYFNRYAVLAIMTLRLMSKSELAVGSQLSLSYVSELLSGKKVDPSPKAVRAIAAALDVDPQAFYFRIDPVRARELGEAA